MSLPKRIWINEVSPRDGLQVWRKFVATEQKIKWIKSLATTGLSAIEVTSFVSSKKVPQLADADTVMTQLQALQVHLSALVPNQKGFERAIAGNCGAISIFTSPSNAFCEKNIGCNSANSLVRYASIIQQAKEKNLFVRGYLSCAWGCPFEGSIKADDVVKIALKLSELGCDEISLGDTTGQATPSSTQTVLMRIFEKLSSEHVALHFHDQYGRGLLNAYAAMQCGAWRFDSAVAGLGGCPTVPNAAGNISTEDLVALADKMGITTGIDLGKLAKAGQEICDILGTNNQSRTGHTVLKLN